MPEAPAPVTFVVWSDYLCPWCYNAAVRLARACDELEGRVRLEWRSYLLRPRPERSRDLERFRVYTQSWLRPAAESDGGTFRTWQGDAGPPSHSVPPHLVAKAAARLGAASFERMHERLLHAYFAENRDVTDPGTLRALWGEAGLPPDAFAASEDPALLSAVLGEHDQAVDLGITGVPTVVLQGNDALVMGAQPLEVYRRWFRRAADGLALQGGRG
jgi:predicted DsbA family dithiol-disulfide isomerase